MAIKVIVAEMKLITLTVNNYGGGRSTVENF